MSYNGSGVFTINTAGQPVITGTTISSTTFNNLTADLATGLTTALTKDGQSTPTSNIGMGAFKITNLAAGTVASDAARLDQVQGGAATFISVTGTDTLTGTVVPALSAYATGNQFSFLVANTNTGAVTINVDGIGSKAITRTGTTALVAGDMVAGQAVEIIYDGTRFQLVNGNSFTNLKVSGTLGVTGVATFTAQPIVSSLTASLPVFTDASKGLVSNTMTGTGNVVMSTNAVLTTPALGTPSALVGTNITGTAAGLTAGNVTTNANLTGGVTSVGNVATVVTNANLTGAITSVGNAASLGSFTSAQLAAALTDETGSGANVFSTSPTLTTPVINGFTGNTSVINIGSGQIYKDASGYVGIGTALPAGKLDVTTGTYRGYFDDNGGAAFRVDAVNAANSAYGPLALNGSVIIFQASTVEKMRIDSTGILLVGKSTSSASVEGNAFGLSTAINYNESVSTNAGGTIALWYMNRQSSAGSVIDFRQASITVGSITVTASATLYNVTSDQRLKNDLGIVTETNIIDDTVIHDFTWKSNGTQSRGVFAQEAVKVNPSAVSVGDDGEEVIKQWQVDYSKYVPDLIVYCQHLKKQASEQQALITQLQADVATLKALSA